MRLLAICLMMALVPPEALAEDATSKPNIVLVMADDQGWGQTGYYDHPILETPNLDAMAANGLRFDRFYAGAFTCSPTRATVLTGRTNDRSGVKEHGHALRLQERTIAQVLSEAGYQTGHFGKWHLNGVRGPGIPVLKTDPRNPGAFGFQTWLSVTNFFDRDPVMSRMGEFEEFTGDSSEIIVAEALKFIEGQVRESEPFFTVIWYGTPHSPWRASEQDRRPFQDLPETNARNHYGELVAMDRSVGQLRQGLRDLEVAENTIVWFCSDNGGLAKQFGPTTVGGLRGSKGTNFEGGLRVPGILEWPAVIEEARVTPYPAATFDIAPTLVDIVGLPESTLLTPQDGISLKPLLSEQLERRESPLHFRQRGRIAIVDNDVKLLAQNWETGPFELYHLIDDPAETRNLADEQPELAQRLRERLLRWNATVEASVTGRDYPEGRVDPANPEPRQWRDMREYEGFREQYRERLGLRPAESR